MGFEPGETDHAGGTRQKKAAKRTAEQALAELQAKAGQTPPAPVAPAPKPSTADNYKTLGQKMMKSGRRAMGYEK